MTELTADVQTNLRMVRAASRAVFTDSQMMADLCFTQAVHESNLLRYPSQLALKYNNLFGIKGKGLEGESVDLPTWEEVDGHVEHVLAEFAVNHSVAESCQQYYNLMQKDRYDPVWDADTLDDAFIQIVRCGYATDPMYTNSLRHVWEQIKDISSDDPSIT